MEAESLAKIYIHMMITGYGTSHITHMMKILVCMKNEQSSCKCNNKLEPSHVRYPREKAPSFL